MINSTHPQITSVILIEQTLINFCGEKKTLINFWMERRIIVVVVKNEKIVDQPCLTNCDNSLESWQ